MEASRVICTNSIVIVVPKTYKELISIVLEVRSVVDMICRYEYFIGGSYNTIIAVKLTILSVTDEYNTPASITQNDKCIKILLCSAPWTRVRCLKACHT